MANLDQLKLLKKGVTSWNTRSQKKWHPNSDAKDVDLRHAKLNNIELAGVNLWNADFSGADLTDADFSGADLQYAKFNGACLLRARLCNANLNCVDFTDADLTFADFRHATLTMAHLAKANLFTANFRDTKCNGADFSSADFMGADFRDTDLGGAKLRNADDLHLALFTCASFRSAKLTGVNFGRGKLLGADFSEAILTDANLSECNLVYADFTSANLYKTKLGQAIFGNTTLANVDLSSVVELDRVFHRSPSNVGIDSLYKSQGRIPDKFLRDAGVPEEIIDIARSIRNGPPIQWHSCFISYSTKDEEFARRLHSRMREANMRVWFAPEDLKGGKKLHEQLFEAIQMNDRLLIVLSEHSIQSEWVMTEIRKARETEKKEKRRKLFPIRLIDFETLRDWTCFDADTGKDLAVEVREYFIPDFSNWKNHDAFQSAFARLKKDLEAENSNTP